MGTKSEKVRVTLKKGIIGCNPKQRACVQGLGLRKIRQSVVLNKTLPIMGMVNKVSFLLSVEDVSE